MKTLLLSATMFLAACQAAVGSGTSSTTTREVAAFRRVSIASGIAATITTGSRSVTIRADDNLQSLVETFIQGETLTVRLKPMTLLGAHGPLEAAISNDLIEGLEASGGSRIDSALTPVTELRVAASGGSSIDARPVSSTSVTVEASGGSHVTLAGAATSATVSGSGASALSLRELPLDTLTMQLSGGSSLTARVASALSGSASGASSATIVGTPASSVEVSGASEVKTGAQ